MLLVTALDSADATSTPPMLAGLSAGKIDKAENWKSKFVL
jgi:hypothetical protein